MMRRAGAVLLLAFGMLCLVRSGPAQDSAKPARPDLQLWAALKRSLTGAEGEQYFQQNLKDTALPVIVGTLISSSPAERPTVLVLGISDPSTPEVTLRIKDDNGKEASLNGPLMRGSQIRFEGSPAAFTKEPFMLTFDTSPKFGKPRKR